MAFSSKELFELFEDDAFIKASTNAAKAAAKPSTKTPPSAEAHASAPVTPAAKSMDRLKQGMAAVADVSKNKGKKAAARGGFAGWKDRDGGSKVNPVADQEAGQGPKAKRTSGKKSIDAKVAKAADKLNKENIKKEVGRDKPTAHAAPPGGFGGNLDQPAIRRKNAPPTGTTTPEPVKAAAGSAQASPAGGFAGDKDRPASERKAGAGVDFKTLAKHIIDAPAAGKEHKQMMKSTSSKTVQGRLTKQKVARVKNSRSGYSKGGGIVGHIKDLYNRFSKTVKGTY